ncbi:hypothetical protein TrLO_g7279 [Triparma laevis f. longispina]|uniref:Uncharacterized protein n=1 Tax=Triparma laevis f. longispina TaxID=1714387 RepID=A0A9W7E0W4_9STRA|nr:hypothetical protein TrLO_g7279 [Triparma laevis f. longispina]
MCKCSVPILPIIDCYTIHVPILNKEWALKYSKDNNPNNNPLFTYVDSQITLNNGIILENAKIESEYTWKFKGKKWRDPHLNPEPNEAVSPDPIIKKLEYLWNENYLIGSMHDPLSSLTLKIADSAKTSITWEYEERECNISRMCDVYFEGYLRGLMSPQCNSEDCDGTFTIPVFLGERIKDYIREEKKEDKVYWKYCFDDSLKPEEKIDFPNTTPTGSLFSLITQALHSGKNITPIVEKWKEVVDKLRGEVEGGKFGGGFDGGWGVLGQKIGVLGEVGRRGISVVTPPAPPSNSEEEKEEETGDNEDDEFHDAIPTLTDSPKPNPKPKTITFPHLPPPPTTIDVKLQRNIMLSLSSGEDKLILEDSFYRRRVERDCECFKFYNGVGFEEFKIWSEEEYDFEYDRLKEVWDEASPKSLEDVSTNFDIDSEVEKSLHWLENIPNYVLMNQLLSQSFSNAYYALRDFGGESMLMEELKNKIFKCCSLLNNEILEGECVTEIREKNLIEQEVLKECDETIEMVRRVEVELCRRRSIKVKTGIDFEGEGREIEIEDSEQTMEYIQYHSDGKPSKIVFEDWKDERRIWGRYHKGEWSLESCIAGEM